MQNVSDIPLWDVKDPGTFDISGFSAEGTLISVSEYYEGHLCLKRTGIKRS